MSHQDFSADSGWDILVLLYVDYVIIFIYRVTFSIVSILSYNKTFLRITQNSIFYVIM